MSYLVFDSSKSTFLLYSTTTTMAPLDTPWYEWAAALPGSVDKGPIPSKMIVFVPLTVFVLQAIYALCVFRAPKALQKISHFYSTLVVLNILTMAFATGLLSLNGLLPALVDHSDKHKRLDLMGGTALSVWYLVVFLCGGFNCVGIFGRLVFDLYGGRAAVQFIPVAILMQGWQLLALPGGYAPLSGFVALILIDFVQHGLALLFWSFQLCFQSDVQVDKQRSWLGIGGVVFHIAAAFPQTVYLANNTVEFQTTTGLCFVYLVTILLLFASHCCWIAMALRTPPRVSEDPMELSKSERTELAEDASIWALL